MSNRRLHKSLSPIQRRTLLCIAKANKSLLMRVVAAMLNVRRMRRDTFTVLQDYGWAVVDGDSVVVTAAGIERAGEM